MKARPSHVVLFLSVVTFTLVLAGIPSSTWPTTAAISLASGASALVLMSAAALLGGRWRLVESVFGGLDRVYRAHKWLGVWALAFASFHLVFKAGMKGWEAAAIFDLAAPYARLVRQLSFVALMLIVLLALNRNISYRIWRYWHKLSGPLLLVVIAHWLTIKSPIALASPAGVWIAAMAGLGVAAAAYKLLLYPLLSSHAEYRVVSVRPGPSALRLDLAPVGEGIGFEPGQFAFLSMKHGGLREPHPFTIASAGHADGHVTFVIRALGDYTQKLRAEAAAGMYAEVYAPWGRFKRLPSSRREIWIAGGVGISPFIAWLRSPEAGGFDKATLFYLYTPGREFPDIESLAGLARERGAEFVPVAGGPLAPAFVDRFAEIVREQGADAVDLSLCGPEGLLQQVRSMMREHGIPSSRLRHEYFEFR
jgi:predicted ferric reductase